MISTSYLKQQNSSQSKSQKIHMAIKQTKLNPPYFDIGHSLPMPIKASTKH